MATGPRKNWRGEAASPTGPAAAKGSRGKQIFTIILTMTVLGGVVAAFFFFFRPVKDPRAVIIAVQEYKKRHYPPNAFARQDGQALESGPIKWKAESAYTQQEKALLQKVLGELRNHDADQTTVIYLNALALAEAGEVHLIPADANPDEPSSWLPMKDVLKTVQACPAKRKLLLLDVMKPIADARLGVLANDTAERLWEDLKAAVQQDPHLWILTACSPGQVSLTSEELERSIFAYYAEEALLGGAAAEGARAVKLQELARYVKERVDKWASRNRNARQTPVLHGADADFELVLVSEGDRQPMTASTLTAYPDWLADGWKRRDQWLQYEHYRAAPYAFAQLNALLLLSEQRWAAGFTPEQVRKNLIDEGRLLEEALKTARAAAPQPQPAAARSLALAAVLAVPPDPPIERKPADAKPAKPADKKPEEKKPEEKKPELADDLKKLNRIRGSKEKPEVVKEKLKTEKENFAQAWKGRPVEVGWAVFESLAADRSPDHIMVLSELLQEFDPRRDFVETLLVHRLADLARRSKEPKSWPANEVKQLIDVTRAGERAHAGLRLDASGAPQPGFDPRAFPWLRHELARAAELRHQGEQFLFARGYVALNKAADLLSEAEAAYTSVNNAIESLQAAWRLHDEAMALLPGYVPLLTSIHHANVELVRVDEWVEAVDLALRLHECLAKYPPGTGPKTASELPAELRELDKRAEALRGQLDVLRRPFRDGRTLKGVVEEAGRPDAPHASLMAHYARIQAFLSTPWLSAEDRIGLWTRGRELAKRLHTTPPPQEPLLYEFDRSRQTQFVVQEQQRAARRAKLAIELFRLGDHDQQSSLQAALDKLTRSDAKETDWQLLGKGIRVSWGQALFQNLRDAKDPWILDRLGRIQHPMDQAGSLQDAETSPAVQLRRTEAAGQWRWLAEEYDRASRDALVGNRDFFADAAAECRRQAGGEGGLERLPRPSFQMLEPLKVSSAVRDATAPLQVVLPPPYKLVPDKDAVRTFAADDEWLSAQPASVLLEGKQVESVKQGEYVVPLIVGLRADAERSPLPRPPGFLVQALLSGRSYHFAVPVDAPEPESKRLRIVFRGDPNAPPETIDRLRLRPNPAVVRPVQVFIENPTGEPRKVIVRLLADNRPVAESGVFELGAEKKETPVVLRRTLPLTGDKSELISVDKAMRVRLVEADKETLLAERLLAVGVAAPQEYVEPPRVQFEPANDKNEGKNSLEVKLKPGPNCPARVTVLDTQFQEIKAEGSNEIELPPGVAEGAIKLQNLLFRDDFNERGLIQVDLDTYPRAYVFDAALPRTGNQPTNPQLRRGRDARLKASATLRPDGKIELRVHLETYNLPADARMELLFDRDGGGAFQKIRDFDTPRQQSLSFRVLPEGGLLEFRAESKEWSHALDVTGLRGEHELKVRLRDPDGRATDMPPLAVRLSPPSEARFVDVADVKVPQDADSIPVIRSKDTERLRVVASAKDADAAYFFTGELPKDGKLPKDVIKGTSLPGGGFAARIPMAEKNAKGPPERVRVFVRFISSIGLESPDQSLLVTLEDKKEEKPTHAVIAGKVTFNGKPQPGFNVKLTEEKKKTTREETTNEEGEFLFKKVEPGSYQLSTGKGIQTGVEPVGEVKAGDEKRGLEIKLKN